MHSGGSYHLLDAVTTLLPVPECLRRFPTQTVDAQRQVLRSDYSSTDGKPRHIPQSSKKINLPREGNSRVLLYLKSH